MKKSNKGYMLAETLIVTAFVAGVLIYLCVQLTNLGNSYERNHSYNTVSDLYALNDIIYYINEDSYLVDLVSAIDEIDEICGSDDTTTSCSSFLSLLSIEEIDRLLISKNDSTVDFSSYDGSLKDFIDTISFDGSDEYRLIALFTNGTYASLKFNLLGGN